MDSKLSILLSLVDLTLFDPPPDMEEPPLGAGESRMVVLEAERPLLLEEQVWSLTQFYSVDFS